MGFGELGNSVHADGQPTKHTLAAPKVYGLEARHDAASWNPFRTRNSGPLNRNEQLPFPRLPTRFWGSVLTHNPLSARTFTFVFTMDTKVAVCYAIPRKPATEMAL